MSAAPPRHAVVIGGSLAGMCVARALADFVDRVTVVERDRFPDSPAVRKGVPQAHHLHVLVTAGQRALERLFPGIIEELHAAGAVRVAAPTDILYLTATGWRQRFAATHRLVGASRELIDWTVHKRLSTDGRIRFLPGHDAVGLLTAGPDGARGGSAGGDPASGDPEGSGAAGGDPAGGGRARGGGAGGQAVTGVRLRARGADGHAAAAPAGRETDGGAAGGRGGGDRGGGGGGADRVVELAADLVVDASGRGSRAPDWLAALGYPRPAETRIDAGLGYASRRYVLPDGAVGNWKNVLILPDPPRSGRGAVLYPIEGDRWMLTLGGLGDDKPPTDDAGFLEFVRGLRSPVIYDAIKDGRPDSPVHGFQQTSNHRRHYESMRDWPHGFLVVGDAVCAFNPVYGHGMSVAAQTAVALAEHLRTRPGGRLDRQAQAIAARCADAAWLVATGADSRIPGTTGATPGLRDRFSHRYLNRASDVANRDPYVAKVLTDVMHLVAPPTALLRPGVVARVARGRPGRPLWSPPEPETQ